MSKDMMGAGGAGKYLQQITGLDDAAL